MIQFLDDFTNFQGFHLCEGFFIIVKLNENGSVGVPCFQPYFRGGNGLGGYAAFVTLVGLSVWRCGSREEENRFNES